MQERRPSGLGPDVDESLLLLGLTSEERSVYGQLMRLGDCTAGDVARLTHLSRASAYQVLRDLATEGLVQELPGRPLRFRALDLPQALRAYATMATERARRLLELAERVPARMVSAGGDVARPEHVSVFSGRQAVYREIQRLLHSAKGVARLCGNERFSARLAASDDLLFSLQQASRNGVDVAVIVPAGPSANLIAGRLGEAVVSALPPDNQRIVVWAVIDDQAMSVLPQPDDEQPHKGEDLGIKVESRKIAQAVRRRLDQLRVGHRMQRPPRQTRESAKAPRGGTLAEGDEGTASGHPA